MQWCQPGTCGRGELVHVARSLCSLKKTVLSTTSTPRRRPCLAPWLRFAVQWIGLFYPTRFSVCKCVDSVGLFHPEVSSIPIHSTWQSRRRMWISPTFFWTLVFSWLARRFPAATDHGRRCICCFVYLSLIIINQI